MKYKIRKTGHIEVTGKREGKMYGEMISPIEQIPAEYRKEIESDSNFEKYRTQENADAYEAKLEEMKPAAEELAEQEERRLLQEQREQAKEELKGTLPPQSNPELVKRVEKLEFILGIRDNYIK